MERTMKHIKIIVATTKSWNIRNAESLAESMKDEVTVALITERKDLNIEYVTDINPDYILFPHWSWVIPKEIHENYRCIVFHMTDLPFGRGGSPLQNLILRGFEETKISAIEVTEEIDAGRIYFKRPLQLDGNADEILMRASSVVFSDMIPFIIHNEIVPIDQSGEVTTFKRRTPKDSCINGEIKSVRQVYDFIRMLDGEGYPNAFIKIGKIKYCFSSASFDGDQVIAKVIIKEDIDE